MTGAAAWTILPFEPAYQAGVGALISGIQRGEFGLSITPQDQPDLMDIPGFYVAGSHGPGGFWVGLDGQGVVVGSIALLNIGGGQGALRKMFVAPGWRGPDSRGPGLAAALLETLVGNCAGHGVGQLFLGTTDRFLAAHRFYEKHGFARLDKSALPPRFPVMAVDTVFYAKSLFSA